MGLFSRWTNPDYWIMVMLALPGMLAGLTFHEFAHAWMANKLGDPTAKMMGRLTLNPLRHLNLIGTLAIVLLGFGWAKPVPINPDNFRDRRKGTLLVSIAGPGANLVLALLLAALFRLVGLISLQTSPVIAYIQGILGLAVFYNLILAFFNMIPIPPLDGSQ
ncbi:site-2 protease family protein, partial [candidate division WOR-3 bacterium]|nr:site-2 protease family protein [candidate division WOR-3 bacterium]